MAGTATKAANESWPAIRRRMKACALLFEKRPNAPPAHHSSRCRVQALPTTFWFFVFPVDWQVLRPQFCGFLNLHFGDLCSFQTPGIPDHFCGSQAQRFGRGLAWGHERSRTLPVRSRCRNRMMISYRMPLSDDELRTEQFQNRHKLPKTHCGRVFFNGSDTRLGYAKQGGQLHLAETCRFAQ